ncbi:MAG: ISKra4 family transposase [Bryobacterales bacterium]|nr:ISKra4 family transposase [Bryobacterales bacterium]
MENAAKQCALRLAATALEKYLNQDHSDYAGPQLACRCGNTAKSLDRRSKTFLTVLGEVTLWRAYYHCAHCESGFFPRDRELGLEDGSESPGIQRMNALTAAMVSFQEGSLLLQELAGVEINAKRVERCAKKIGAEVATDEKLHIAPLDPDSCLPNSMFLSMDGTGIPVRPSEVEGRSGKQPDSPAKTREVKLCVIWSADSRDEKGKPLCDPGSVSYSAAIESAATRDTDEHRSEFAERVLREATRRRFAEAGKTAVVADLAVWIWNIAQELYPRAEQIGDRYHVKERLSTVGKDVFSAGSQQAKEWIKARWDELDAGSLDDLQAVIETHAADSEEARKCLGYLVNNRDRMRYPKFEAEGLCTSSGVTEGGCKNAIGTRLKRSGMHWTVRGADAIIALRCCILSGRFQDTWERIIDGRRTRAA